jgi:tetratricopeptide (TPR) repeat protein
MTVTCNDRDRIFEDGTPTDWLALEAHAAGCPACGEELRAWKALSIAAQEMRDCTETPALWARIESALAEEDARRTQRAGRRGWFSFLQNIPVGWQTALAGTFVLLLTISTGWIYVHRPDHTPVSDQSLLKSAALKNVEDAETAYVQAIDKLAAEARPQLDTPATPLLANYHEKLVLLDSAIADLRAQAGMNPSNAQLRHQLLAMYQEKQHTLEEVLEVRQQ